MTDENRKYRLETLALHAGQKVDCDTLSRAVPIYQTSSYVFKSTKHAADLFGLKESGNIYTRLMNPTTDVLEKRIAALEGGLAGLAFSSGMAAITAAVLNICQAGDHIVSASALYGGTVTLFKYTMAKLGIETTFVDVCDVGAFEKAVKKNTKLFYIESCANPKNSIPDFKKIAEVAHKAGVPLICDNTTMSPVLLRPIEHGIDIVVHSCTKIIGGHGTSIGGVVIDSGNFDWAESGRFPMITEPDESYHGIKYVQQFGKQAYIAKARLTLLRDTGACLSPFNAFMLLQGLETMPLRVKRHCANTLALATWLEKNPNVSWVNYPGLQSHKDYELARKYLPDGQGAILGFGVKGGRAAGEKFINSVKLASHLANILDAKTLVIHPASTTHQQLSSEELKAAGVGEDFIRVSVGIENIKDIIEDFDNALK